MADLEARITELEIRLSFQDDFIRKLNDVVRDQSALLEALRKRLDRMEALSDDPLSSDD